MSSCTNLRLSSDFRNFKMADLKVLNAESFADSSFGWSCDIYLCLKAVLSTSTALIFKLCLAVKRTNNLYDLFSDSVNYKNESTDITMKEEIMVPQNAIMHPIILPQKVLG